MVIFPVFNPFPNDRILDMTKLKAFTDDNLNVAKMMIYLFNRVENTGNQPFLLFPLCFQKSCSIDTFLRTKSVTKKEMNKCMAEIYDLGGIRTRAARLISQYHNH